MNTPTNTLVRLIEYLIFASRWFQAPLYLGLIVALGAMTYNFFQELAHLLHTLQVGEGEDRAVLSVLALIDVVMIANLLIMVIVGGYETFVSRLDLEDHPDQPEWLSHINAGVLKIKLSISLVSISSIHLLTVFLNLENLDEKTIKWKIVMHLTFVVSAIVLSYADRVMVQTVLLNKKH
jgi:uncharacterized protein (TIGR00645 family)